MDCKFEEEIEDMKKFRVIALSVLLCVCLLGGCGSSYAADTNTVFVQKDGGIVSTDVEEFDENTYDAEGLKEYVDQAIDTYNEENGKGLVKLKNLAIQDGKATLTIQYASASDYQKFNGIELYTGSVVDALAAGYSFDDSFASVTDGEIASCEAGVFLNDPEYKVVIIRGNTNVKVKGKIAYLSITNTGYVDESTVAIQEGLSLLQTEALSESVTESGTESGTEIDGTEAVDSTEGGAVSEDDLLSTPESTEMIFEFDEEPKKSDSTSEFSQVYTYIIYK